MAEVVIAVDTNILVYAHRSDTDFHAAAKRRLVELAEGRAAWAVPSPCLHEFMCVVTHARIFKPPSTVDEALGQVEAWMESPSLVLLGEPSGYWETMAATLRAARATGPLVYDARIATVCRLHGVRELWTADHDFSRFAGLAVWNPLLPDAAHETALTYGARSVRRRAVKRRTGQRS